MRLRWPWPRREPFALTVDFDREPALPRGTVSVIRHVPAAKGVVALNKDDLVLKPIPPLLPYAEYYRRYGGAGCGDVNILDTLFDYLKAHHSDPHPVLRDLFGDDFWGQIFFLGTSFAAQDGGAECVAFLNIRTARITGMPAIRYSCPAGNPVRPDVPVFACFLSDRKRSV